LHDIDGILITVVRALSKIRCCPPLLSSEQEFKLETETFSLRKEHFLEDVRSTCFIKKKFNSHTHPSSHHGEMTLVMGLNTTERHC